MDAYQDAIQVRLMYLKTFHIKNLDTLKILFMVVEIDEVRCTQNVACLV